MTVLDSTAPEQCAVADCCEQHGVVTSVCVQARDFWGVRIDIGLSRTPLHQVTSLLLTAWSGVLIEKLTGSSRDSPTSYGTQRFITALTSVRHLSLS